jgi:hypothetical protein
MNEFSLMMWQKPGLAWVRLHGDKQWILVARADDEEDGGEMYLNMAKLQGALRSENYEKKDLDLCLQMAYDAYNDYE